MQESPNPQRRSERSHRATLKAALDLCAEQGYAQVTVEGIAARAGVSKKTIYRWWPSKGAVMLEAIDEAALQPTGFSDTGDLAADLHQQMSGTLSLLTDAGIRSAILGVLAEGLQDSQLAGQVHGSLFKPRIDSFKERMRKAQQQGELAAEADVDVALDLLYGPIWHRLVAHLPLPDGPYLSKIIDAALAAVNRRA
ncbi:TetR/AcrR family transcriptional regulator [Actinomadura rudentiformis]|uniref:TetR/AcrR family transcriptional regulator n=1 Tax=Actinomadura rudentiformis TaxID=359158 RepID=A0A6H9Z5W9_9ACTN|nr:TetR/AcrR family transcriptional regulator [Actinomadura rudentiformis]KAB2350240.1 TetR/AcrR family transcriptional regulator [Actinomadura rudentiformis]